MLNIIKQKNYKKPLHQKTLHRSFENQFDDPTFGEKIAINFTDKFGVKRTTSYDYLNSTSNKIASALMEKFQAENLTPNNDGDWIVCVCMKPSDDLITALLSIWKCGAAYLPLDVGYPKSRIIHIINEAKPIAVIYDDDFDRPEIFSSSSILPIKFHEFKEFSKTFSNSDIRESSMLTENSSGMAIIFYTSGSTGVPKGVRLSRENVQIRIEWQWRRFPYSKTEHFGVFKTSLPFLDSITEIWGPLLNGMTVVVVPKEVTLNPDQFIKVLDEYEIERLYLVPTLLRSILMWLSMSKNNNRPLKNLKMVTCSGESLPLQLAKDFFDYFDDGSCILCNLYGATEVDATFYVCESKAELETLSRIPIGQETYDYTDIYLLDKNSNPVKNGQIGELYVSSSSLVSGYCNGRDADQFVNNPFTTDPDHSKMYKVGDYASFSNGLLYYEGRSDNQVKVRGHRIDLLEIEKQLLAIDDVENGIVLCYRPGEIDQALVAFCKIKSDDIMTKSDKHIEKLLAMELPNYMVPQVVVLEKIPLLVSGKIDRQSLLKMHEKEKGCTNGKEGSEYDFTGLIEENEIEKAKALFEIISNAIGRSIRSKISASANFYELGGNSLNSIFTVTQLKNNGYLVSIADFITAKNLHEIITNMKVVEVSDDVESEDSYDSLDVCELPMKCNMELICIPLQPEHREEAIDITAASFYNKSEVEKYIKDEIKKDNFVFALNSIYDYLVARKLSFIVKDSNGRTVGVSFNYDALDPPHFELTNSRLDITIDFYEYIEKPVRDNLFLKGFNKIFYCFMAATSTALNASENIALMYYMDIEAMKVAKRKKFAGVLATNISTLTQQIDTDLLKYETMCEYQINRYVHTDGTRPFGKAPDSQKILIQWKKL